MSWAGVSVFVGLLVLAAADWRLALGVACVLVGLWNRS